MRIIYSSENKLCHKWEPGFKETTNCKIHQAVGAIWAPGTDFS